MKTDCELHGDSRLVEFEDRLVCESCIEEYDRNIKELEKMGYETILNIHDAVGRGLKSRLKDPAAFARLKVATEKGLDVLATYHRIVTDVCEKVKMN